MEGVGQDIDIGVYDMKVNNVISSSLSSKDGMLYMMVRSSKGWCNIKHTYYRVIKYVGCTNGMLMLSQLSIVEGVGHVLVYTI